jgi:hypothetical protein
MFAEFSSVLTKADFSFSLLALALSVAATPPIEAKEQVVPILTKYDCTVPELISSQ